LRNPEIPYSGRIDFLDAKVQSVFKIRCEYVILQNRMERRMQDKGFIISVIDVNGILESYKPKETERIAMGFEVEGTLSVRGPDVPDVVSKSPHEVRGSLKHWPGHHVRLASFNSKPKAYGYFGICIAFESMYIPV
jgi:hypothetical protein